VTASLNAPDDIRDANEVEPSAALPRLPANPPAPSATACLGGSTCTCGIDVDDDNDAEAYPACVDCVDFDTLDSHHGCCVVPSSFCTPSVSSECTYELTVTINVAQNETCDFLAIKCGSTELAAGEDVTTFIRGTTGAMALECDQTSPPYGGYNVDGGAAQPFAKREYICEKCDEADV
jgi:hypothetical protein